MQQYQLERELLDIQGIFLLFLRHRSAGATVSQQRQGHLSLPRWRIIRRIGARIQESRGFEWLAAAGNEKYIKAA
jgi:hypothetical protein